MAYYSLSERLKNAWNAFANNYPIGSQTYYGMGYSYRPDHRRLTRGNERSIVTAIYNRIAIDVAAVDIKHVRLNDEGRYVDTIQSGLNNCLSLEANIDQTGRSFIQDIVLSMLDEGSVAVVPVDTSVNPYNTESYDIKTMRVGKITEWMPEHVRVNLYNDRNGRHEDLILPKRTIAILENPLYAVMNEPNSTLQRLIRKLNLLDNIDEQAGAGKLDLIIQLPYVVKTPQRRAQAEQRRKDIELQLASSKYGIAYTDGTEKITQLNRSVDNQLLAQVESLTSTLYGQLGITEDVMKGTADEKAMLNYHNRTIEPILSTITDEFTRKFLTKTARTQLQSVEFFKDPFRLVPVNNIAEIADKFTRNEIMTPNEIRQVVGMKPSMQEGADELRNRNINQNSQEILPGQDPYMDEGYEDPTNPMDMQVSQLG